MGIKLTRPQNPRIVDPKTGNIDQNWATQLNALFDAIAGPLPLRVFAKAQLPAAAKYANNIVFVPDDVAGPCLAVSDGTNWKKITLGATVS